MADRMCLIGANNAMLDDDFTGNEDTLEPGQRLVFAPINMDAADGFTWSQELNGWEAKIKPIELISIAAFMQLFTQGERIAIRIARATDPYVADFWELLLACTSGVYLGHPVVIAGVGHLADAELVTEARATAILAGEAP